MLSKMLIAYPYSIMPSPNKTWSNLHACQFLFTQPQNHTVLTIGSNWSRGNSHKAMSNRRQALGPHWRLPTPIWHTCVISVSSCPLTFPWTTFRSVSLLVSFVFIIEIGCGYLPIQEAFLAAWSIPSTPSLRPLTTFYESCLLLLYHTPSSWGQGPPFWFIAQHNTWEHITRSQ